MLIKNKLLRGIIGIFIAVSCVAIWMHVGIESSLISAYGEICTQNDQANDKECSVHHISLVTLWKIAEFFKYFEGGITALSTVIIAAFTWRLWDSTHNLWQEAILSRGTAQTSADAARDSADAAVKSAMPVLFPYVTNMHRLHPLDPSDSTFTYDSNIFIAFDNYGKTPAIIKEFRGELYLTESDILPRGVDTAKLKSRTYNVIVPGDFRGKDITTGALDFRQPFTITPTDLNELFSEAVGKFKRFALIGQVIYDDLFGNRHTRRFFVKMRWFEVPMSKKVIHAKGFRYTNNFIARAPFQINQGESEYNRITIEKKPDPKNDPFEAS